MINCDFKEGKCISKKCPTGSRGEEVKQNLEKLLASEPIFSLVEEEKQNLKKRQAGEPIFSQEEGLAVRRIGEFFSISTMISTDI